MIDDDGERIQYPAMAPFSREYRLLGILQEHAPTGSAQMKCTEAVHEMQKAGASGLEIEKALLGWILDGLTYGNWLWLMEEHHGP